MSVKEFDTQKLINILPFLSKFIERNEINISTLSKNMGINRKTLYNKLYGKRLDLDFISKLCQSLGIEIKIGFTINQ